MAPKKKGGKAKGGKGTKGKKGKGISDDVNPDEKCWILQAEIDALNDLFFEMQTMANEKKKQEQESRYRDAQLKQMEEEEKRCHRDIVADMVRQYKSTQEELSFQYAMLQTQIEDNRHEIENLEKKKQEVEQEMNEARNKKDEIILDLTNNIDKMTQQFSKMLQDTLEKMKSRI